MNTLKIILLVLMTGISYVVQAGDGDYAFNKIQPNLLKNAHAVKRFENIRFEVISKTKAKYIRKVAYTILNDKGDKFAFCLANYDKLQSVESIEGRLFDESGKKIKSLRKSDIQDMSGNDGSNLADDNRIKYHNFHHKVYPYTVEYETEIRYNYTLFYPGWIAQDDKYLSVESGRISVVIPQGMSFRYKAFNFTNEPVITEEKSSKVHTWEVKNLQALEPEFASPHWFELTPVVCMGPVQFAVEGYEGNMSSWQDFGKFLYALKEGRDVLPENIKRTVHELTDGLSDPVQKIAALYTFLQNNTRYISVQVGVGGWRPYDAQYVAANRYGDCKALTNYMFSLLKEAGIKSHYTLVKAGQGNTFLISDFPSQQFNHVILSVPLKGDTVWLECTSQTLPAGYLSSFTSNRQVLMVDENGGKLVKTPKYSLIENLQIRKIAASLNPEGQLSTDISTLYMATQEDKVHSLIKEHSKENVLDYLKEEIDLSDYDVLSFNYREEKSRLPSVTETLKLTVNHYAQVTGKRLFVSPNILSKSQGKLARDTTRKFDVELKVEYTDIDTIEISIPAGYQPEVIPPDVTINTKYGRYSSSVSFANDKITYFRSMEQLSGRFPAKEYNEVVKFYEQVYKADRSKVVFTRKD